MRIYRFLWADLQVKAICDACEEDGTPERIPDLLESLPRQLSELYLFFLAKVSQESDERVRLARNVFQWITCSRRELTILELEEAISIHADQKLWQAPSFQLDVSKLCKMCGNLIKYDKINNVISLAHHTVLSFLSSCSDIPEISSLYFDENGAQQYVADICITYLSFTDFNKSVVPTLDTRNARALNRPVNLVTSLLPNSIRKLPSIQEGSRRFRRSKDINVVNILRSELSASQPRRMGSQYTLLKYCKNHWHDHTRYIEPQDPKRMAILEDFVCRASLPLEWKPWDSLGNENCMPNWKIFLWAVSEGHKVIFNIWQKNAKLDKTSYWNLLWLERGQKLFASACTTANIERLDILLHARQEKMAKRPTRDEITRGLVNACYLGLSEVVERLLQEKADVNAPAASRGRTALQAAAEGGHLAIVERLVQEKADVSAPAAASEGRTALEAAAEGGHLAVIALLHKVSR